MGFLLMLVIAGVVMCMRACVCVLGKVFLLEQLFMLLQNWALSLYHSGTLWTEGFASLSTHIMPYIPHSTQESPRLSEMKKELRL